MWVSALCTLISGCLFALCQLKIFLRDEQDGAYDFYIYFAKSQRAFFIGCITAALALLMFGASDPITSLLFLIGVASVSLEF
jgi:hypothetical protein